MTAAPDTSAMREALQRAGGLEGQVLDDVIAKLLTLGVHVGSELVFLSYYLK